MPPPLPGDPKNSKQDGFGFALGNKRGHSVFMMITYVGVSSVYIIIANVGGL
jgi:hypothetical protein